MDQKKITHYKNEEEYNKEMIHRNKIFEKGGTIETHFGKAMESNLLSKTI